MTRSRWIVVAVAVLAVVATVGPTNPATAASPADGSIRHADSPDAIPGRYIVVLDEPAARADAVRSAATRLADRYGGRLAHTYTAALRGFSVSMDPAQARRVAAQPGVAYVEADQRIRLAAEDSSPPSWGLDRIDGRPGRALDNAYRWPDNGWGEYVRAYVIDSGIRATHQEFGGRVQVGWDFIDDDANAGDCNGHGTHVAGTIGGASFGVARLTRLVPIRILDCAGAGTTSDLIAALEWVVDDYATVARPGGWAAVTNISAVAPPSSAADAAAVAVVNAGVTVVVAAGNSAGDACDYSPARVPAAITVAAANADDSRRPTSNVGPCVDVFAPGQAIVSAGHASNTATASLNGTSQAAAHVTGAVVHIVNPGVRSPSDVRNILLLHAPLGMVTGLTNTTFNRYLTTWLGPIVSVSCERRPAPGFLCDADISPGVAAVSPILWWVDGNQVNAWTGDMTVTRTCLPDRTYVVSVGVADAAGLADGDRTSVHCRPGNP